MRQRDIDLEREYKNAVRLRRLALNYEKLENRKNRVFKQVFKKQNQSNVKIKKIKIKTKERIKNMFDVSEIITLLREKSIAGINHKYDDKDIIRYKELRAVKHKAKGFCLVCKVKKADCIHHIILLKHGGTNGKNNLLPICNNCHKKIHDWLK